jgi:hypothetical protein
VSKRQLATTAHVRLASDNRHSWAARMCKCCRPLQHSTRYGGAPIAQRRGLSKVLDAAAAEHGHPKSRDLPFAPVSAQLPAVPPQLKSAASTAIFKHSAEILLRCFRVGHFYSTDATRRTHCWWEKRSRQFSPVLARSAQSRHFNTIATFRVAAFSRVEGSIVG